jgi:hypothetical protein
VLLGNLIPALNEVEMNIEILKSSRLVLTGGLIATLTLAEAASPKNTATNIHEKNKATVYFIKTTGTEAKQGSAVAIESSSKSSILATNCHVVEGENSVSVSNDGLNIKAKVVVCDKKKDIALLVVDQKLPSAIIEKTPSKIGETVFSLGNPLGLRHSISEGIISRLHANKDGLELIQSTAAIEPGSSGGGLFNTSGKLVGITSSKISGSQGINFSIKITDFLPFIPQAKGEIDYRKEAPISSNDRPKISYDIKGFTIGAHCSSTADAVKQLTIEQLQSPPAEPAFCSKSWDGEGDYVWASFSLLDKQTYRKRMFTVGVDSGFYIDSISMLDVWFYGQQVNYPSLEDIRKQVEVKYGQPLFSGKLEDDMTKSKFIPRNEIIQSDVWIYFKGDVPEFITKEIGNAKKPNSALSAIRKAAGDYLFIELSERRETTGKPLGFSFELKAGRGSATATKKDSQEAPAIRF